jgi:Ca2+-binding RTX toxin-like protein
MTTTTVDSSAALLAALAKAQSGDTILLSPGEYATLVIKGFQFPTGVTIASADPNSPAKLLGLTVRDCSGINFSNLEMDASAHTADWGFAVYYSKNISFSGVHVHGSLDGNPQNDVAALMIRWSEGVTVKGSEFEQLKHGVAFLDSNNLEFSGNSFHDLRTDGIHGGGASFVKISGNSFTDFYPIEGDHPDAVQFWTTNTTAVAHDIVITDNVITRGKGAPVQGIFFRDQVGTLPFENVTISGNMLVGTLWHGITVGGGKNLSIVGNIVAGLPDQLSWIRVTNASGVNLQENKAGKITLVEVTELTNSGNVLFLPTHEEAMQLLSDWLLVHGSLAEQTTETVTNTDTVQVTQFHGGAGNDLLSGSVGADKLFGKLGDDTYVVNHVDDLVFENAGEGTDGINSSIDYTLPANVESLTLTGTAVTANGNDGNNTVEGNAAANLLFGHGGNDSLVGHSGHDTLDGGTGADSMRGGTGDDIYYVDNQLDAVLENSNEGVDLIYSSVNFTMSDFVENLVCDGAAPINATGNGQANRIVGNGAANELIGLEGNDTLIGGGGADVLNGGTGNDLINGGLGRDYMTGGTGADTFIFAQNDFAGLTRTTCDRITDFDAKQGDRFDLRSVDANSLLPGDQAFVFIGSAGFAGVAGSLRCSRASGHTYIEGDFNGDRIADFLIRVDGNHSLSSGDFWL